MGIPAAVLITGASTGIGHTCMLRLHAEGYRVFAGVRRLSDADRLRAATPDRIHPVLLDVTDPGQVAAAVETVRAATGEHGLAGLVNNAGIAVGGPLEFVSTESLRLQFEVNVFGLHAVTRAFLPLIRVAAGRIIHIGSISGRITSPFTGPYAASKHAVEALTDALRLELAPEGIHVAVIEPGQIRTPIWDKGLAEFATISERIPPDGLTRYATRLKVLGRLLELAPRHAAAPETVADAMLHALEAPEPRTRYVVGRDARIRLWLSRLLPDRAMDAVVLTLLRRAEKRLS